MIKFKLDKRLLSPTLNGTYLLTYASIASQLMINEPYKKPSKEMIYKHIGATSPCYVNEALQYLEENGFLRIDVKGGKGTRRYEFHINEPEDFVWASCEMFGSGFPSVYRVILFRFYSLINSERFSVTYNVRFSIEEFASTSGISIESAKLALLYLASRNILVPSEDGTYVYNEDFSTPYDYYTIEKRRLDGDCFEYAPGLQEKYWEDMDGFISKLNFYRANNPNAYDGYDYEKYRDYMAEPYPVKDMRFIKSIYGNDVYPLDEPKRRLEESNDNSKRRIDRIEKELIRLKREASSIEDSIIEQEVEIALLKNEIRY